MQQWTRRSLIAGGLASPAIYTASRAFAADPAFPARNIQFVIPYAPGGGFDVYVRVIAPVMENYLPRKVNIVPTNVAGGGGSKVTVQLYRARPDGYSIGIFNIPGAFILQQQQGGAAYDLAKLAWIGAIGGSDHYAISVSASS